MLGCSYASDAGGACGCYEGSVFSGLAVEYSGLGVSVLFVGGVLGSASG